MMKNTLLGFIAFCSLVIASVASADLIDIDNKKLRSLIDEGVPVIDVRRLDEWNETGVIKDSHLMTFFDREGNYDAQKWFDELSESINPEEPFVLICHSGARSLSVGKWLGQQFDTVYNAKAGIVSWIEDDNETIPAEGATDETASESE